MKIFNKLFSEINKLDFLISFYITCLMISELMGVKTFPLITILGYHFKASVAIFTIPIIFTVNDVITEVYGKERTRSIIRSGLFMVAFLMFFSLLATNLNPSSRFLTSESHYDYIFQQSFRISAASLIAFAVAEFMDVLVFAKIRSKLGKRKLWLRNNLSNFISQFLDSTVFMFLAFYEFNHSFISNSDYLFGLILPYWMIRCLMSVIETPFVYLGVRWLKNKD
jgi:queuosine precursor transporter